MHQKSSLKGLHPEIIDVDTHTRVCFSSYSTSVSISLSSLSLVSKDRKTTVVYLHTTQPTYIHSKNMSP
uniref:Uncharacterized protein n=1 Tax=Lepeophtheirus salmonis TaxID=72036 RepID=A0A0K2U702_LEPSM